MPTPTPLGAFILKRRLARGWKRPDLERASGVSQHTIKSYEVGQAKDPPLTTVWKIMEALEVSRDDLEAIIVATIEAAERSGPEPDPRFRAGRPRPAFEDAATDWDGTDRRRTDRRTPESRQEAS